MNIKKHLRLLEQHLSKLFPAAKIKFYVSRRSNYVRLGVDRPLLVLDDHEKIVSENKNLCMNSYLNFKFLFPRLINTVHWKFDYIVFEKRKKEFMSDISCFLFVIFIVRS